MSQVVACECGARVRLPGEAADRSLRCPRCKAGIALTASADVLAAAQLAPGQAGTTCPLCQSAVDLGEMVVACPQCDQLHHRECWSELGGCGTYGCSEAPRAPQAAPLTQPLTAWGDTKVCPACAETIKAIALKCRYCGTMFDTVDPLTVADLRRRVRRSEKTQSVKPRVIVLFVLSLVSCILAPLVAIASMVFLLPKRAELSKAGPAYMVMGYSSMIVSVIYSILVVLFFVTEIVGP